MAESKGPLQPLPKAFGIATGVTNPVQSGFYHSIGCS
jgi:hypothetical protein